MEEIKAFFLAATAMQPHRICPHHWAWLAWELTMRCTGTWIRNDLPSSPGSVPENLLLTTFSKKPYRIQSIPSVYIHPKSCKTPPSCNKRTACEAAVVSPDFTLFMANSCSSPSKLFCLWMQPSLAWQHFSSCEARWEQLMKPDTHATYFLSNYSS